MLSARQLWLCIKKAAVNTINHDGIEHAGYLAFLGLLALFPFLVFLIALIGFLGQGQTGIAFINFLLETLPDNITAGLRPRIVEIISGPPQGLLTVSILGAIWTASSAVEGLRTILNRAYHVVTPPAYWFRRSLSVLQLLFVAVILITAMALVVIIPLLWQIIEHVLGITVKLELDRWKILLFPVTITALFLAVSSIYYLIPNIRQRLRAIVPGALAVVVLWLITAHLFTLYLSHFNQVNLIYGSLGGIIAALVFAYICNIIFIFGAELNYQLTQAKGVELVQRRQA